ncbi:hypothetical protein GSI_09774 [Ganoderma sinense ZZ0214-1]|uniref:F-box domain-containing protein n=1 Tax=Ganoderma sinense ZZ0214-1 TaxID=1077348 RepID=A0A2G8S2W4_9APHY|nr:hypothetical protein GSI_09774 [Ganoderma sinense ZZ0214-1]
MSAPINALSVEPPWPRMRELVLQGQLPEGLRSPFITLLSGMPKLRVLRLMFALPHGILPKPIWPRGVDNSLPFPWPELEELVLSFPTPDDQLYGALPACLRRLSLRCCPHHCMHEWVLSQCSLPHLDHLQCEYRADNAEVSLLEHLYPAFPQLLTLELHRFRPAGVDDIPVATIGGELRPLSRLHTLSLHLDSFDHPEPTIESMRMGGFVPVMSWAQREASDSMLHAQADLLAPLLSKSVRLLRLVRRDEQDASWQAYRILRADDSDTGNVLGVCHDAACSKEYFSPDWFVDLIDRD